MNTPTESKKKVGLPLAPNATDDIDAELRRFEEEERKRLGLDKKQQQWVEEMAGLAFTKAQREKYETTILVCGLTMAHDYFVEAALKGRGYRVQHLDAPDNEALRYGKEFGNRAQCNPTYFTVGNLVKYLCTLRDKHGMTSEEVINKYVFLTAGACGPCRFGMYVTEYRKALRDAGFDGFRVMLFQQTGGFSQATGEDSPGIEMSPPFFIGLVKAILAGDVLNCLGYRIRPFEVEPGATDAAIERVKKNVYHALEKNKSVFFALWTARKELGRVKVDKMLPKPKVSIIGEFWAMTTEGDGNYQLQRFLESEGAEADIQLVAAWLLYTIWEGRNDVRDRMNLRGLDDARYGLAGKNGAFDINKTRATLAVADKALRVVFHTFAWFAGLNGYHLPDMDEVAELSHKYYNNNLRGGEGHMEVGKLILNVVKQKSHMTLSVKPFGCMPSAGVSDGVQSLITELHPGSIFCPVETSGDGRVNFYSRVQMYLFKAKLAAIAEQEKTLAAYGLTREQVKEWLAKHPRFAHPLHKSPHAAAGTTSDLIHEIGPRMTQPAWKRWAKDARATIDAVKARGPKVAATARDVWTNRVEYWQMAKEDLAVVREVVEGKLGEEWKAIGASMLKKHDAVHDAHESVGTSPVVAAAE